MMETFYEICAAILFGVAGLCFGSFSNVVIYRLPRGMSLASPPSHCPNCGSRLSPKDNIPLLSYLFLGGKCRYCGAPISPRYFCVELISGLLWLACFFGFYRISPYVAAIDCLAVTVLLCVAFCDEENLFIPDALQAALAVVALAAIAAAPERLTECLIGAAVGGGFYLVFYLGSLLFLKREGIGFGDVKLGAGLGLLLGWKSVLPAVLLASLIALIRVPFGGGRKELFGKEKEYPLAPSIVIAGIFALFAGEGLCDLYLGMIG